MSWYRAVVASHARKARSSPVKRLSSAATSSHTSAAMSSAWCGAMTASILSNLGWNCR
jgi:hypothetical protein